jgi:hypothetical protein
VPDNNSDYRQAASPGPRPYIGMFFECCHVYTRVYRRPGETCYIARCPRCLRSTRIQVAPDGTNTRFLRAR